MMAREEGTGVEALGVKIHQFDLKFNITFSIYSSTLKHVQNF